MIGFVSRSTLLMHAIRHARRFLLPALLSSCLAAGAAHAATAASAPAGKAPVRPAAAAKANAAASAPGKVKLLTQAELRDCKQQEANVLSLTEQARQEKTSLEAEKGEITREGTALGEEIAALDKTNPEAVAAYNAKVEARDKRIDAYQVRVGAFNQKADSVNATRDAYASQCDKRRYDERDLADIKRKK